MVLDAAFDVLATEGWTGTTVRAVCQRARLNPRYFYESFDDLDGLIVAVFDRIIEELTAVVADAQSAADDTPRAQVRATVSAIVGFVDEDRRRGRILYVEALGNETLNRRRLDTARALVGAVEQQGATRRGHRRGADERGRLTAAFVVGGMTEVLVEWLDGRIQRTREQLVDDATSLVLAAGEAAASIKRYS
jgi:AcrR family transcriptional regulator